MHILFTLLLLMTGLPLTSQTTETSLRIFQAQVVDQRILYPKDYVQLRSPENLIAADALKVYPVGRGSPTFERARWVLSEDGFAAVVLPLPRREQPEAISLGGKWKSENRIVRVDLSGVGRFGLTVALSGVMKTKNRGYRFSGVLSAAVRGYYHVERVTLDLTHAAGATAGDWAQPALDNARLRASDVPQTSLLSEPTERIGGVPVPTVYNLTLKVRLDGEEVAPLRAKLHLHRDESTPAPHVGLTLATEGTIVPGWSAWMSTRPQQGGTGTVPEPGIAATARDGRLHVEIKPVSNFRYVQWWTRDPGDPASIAQVLVDKGAIHLQFTGDTCTGTIEGQGFLLTPDRKPAVFAATVAGEHQAAALIRSIKAFLGPRSFGGRWRDIDLGEFSLHQRDKTVEGELSDASVIDGTVSGSVVDLRWRKGKAAGHGFLFTPGSGLLAGVLWPEGNLAKARTLIALQRMPQASTDAEGTTQWSPRDDGEAMQLKFVAYDLAHSGKHSAAVALLRKLVDYYQHKLNATGEKPDAWTQYVIDMALPVFQLIFSSSAAGDYRSMVSALRTAVDMQRQRGREQLGPRLFQSQAEKFAAVLERSAEEMANLARDLERGLSSLVASGVGIGFETNAEFPGAKVTAVDPEKPAGRAGITPGDFIEAVDGVSVRGMTQVEVVTRFRGTAGTTVSVQVSTGERRRQIDLIRVPLIVLAPESRKKLMATLPALRDVASSTATLYREDAATLRKLVRQTGNFAHAFDQMLAVVNRRRDSLPTVREAVALLSERALSGSPTALLLFQRFRELTTRIAEPRGDDASGGLLALDKEVNEFEARPDIIDFEKGLLKICFGLAGALGHMDVETRGTVSNLNQAAKMAAGAQTPAQTAQQLTGLSASIDAARAVLISDQARIEATDLGQAFYAEYIQLLMDLGLPEQALQASEAARARAFADLLVASRSAAAPGRSSRAGVSRRPDVTDPNIAKPLTLAEIRETAIAHRGTIIEYWTSADTISAWVISPDGNIQLGFTAVVPSLAAQIGEIRALMEHGLSDKQRRLRSAELLENLNSVLIAPLAEKNLLPKDPDELVTVIPHGSLFHLPFAALRDTHGKYFIEKHTLTYETAVSVLRLAQNHTARRRLGKPRLVAFVSPKPMLDSEDMSNAALPFTEKAFPEIESLYGSDWVREVYSGVKATTALARSRAPDADVLYFATHGVIAEDPRESYIALAKTAGSDGRLRVSDIYEMKIRVNLVILAACKTAQGRVTGDGVDGFSRAFALAGSANLITTLWSVHEEQMLEVMGYFHEHWLKEKLSKARALRKAQLQRLSIYRNQPNVWAGTVLYGPQDDQQNR